MQPLADAGAMRQFVRFARATGLALDAYLEDELKAIVAESASADRIPAHAIVDCLQVCAAVSRRHDLGVAFAGWVNLRGFGPLSLLWDHCPTVADAVRVNARYVHLESAALGSTIEEDGAEVAVRHLLLIPARYGGSQFIEGTLLLELRIMRLVLGETWAPLRMEFSHAAHPDLRTHARLFRCPMEFGAERSAVVFAREDLTRASSSGNAHMLAYLERHLESVERAWPTDLLRQVEQIIAANLISGRATVPHVAGMLAMSPRTLQRRLETSGVSFAALLDGARRRVAEEYFRTERQPNLTQLAYRLGYTDASAASRFLRARFNSGARELARGAAQMTKPS